jgi:hypothetical protein
MASNSDLGSSWRDSSTDQVLYEGPVKVLAATLEEARERVDHYADLGYVQIKIYSSVKLELVPVIIEEAHKRGLRVSGHVPAGMTADQFVRDGADEIQHMNFVFLNFMPARSIRS